MTDFQYLLNSFDDRSIIERLLDDHPGATLLWMIAIILWAGVAARRPR